MAGLFRQGMVFSVFGLKTINLMLLHLGQKNISCTTIRENFLKDADYDSSKEFKDVRNYAAGVKEKKINNNKYMLSDKKWFPSIIKVNSDGIKSVVVADPLYVSVFNSGLSSFIVMFCFMILCGIWGLTIYFAVNLE